MQDAAGVSYGVDVLEELSRETERRDTAEAAAAAASEIAELKDERHAAESAAKFTARVIDGLKETIRAAAEDADLAAAAAAEEIAGLKLGMERRHLIGQAQGILMERHNIDADQAFAYLTRVSQNSNVKLHVLAEELVRTRRLPGRPRRSDVH